MQIAQPQELPDLAWQHVCTKALKDLRVVAIKDLVFDNYLKDSVILFRLLQEPTNEVCYFRFGGVQDLDGVVSVLCVYHLDPFINGSLKRRWKLGDVIAVKEPIRSNRWHIPLVIVHQPSNVIKLNFYDDLIPPKWRRFPGKMSIVSSFSFKVWSSRVVAHDCMEQKEWHLAKEALMYAVANAQTSPNVFFRIEMHSMSAACALELQHYDAALEHALKAVISDQEAFMFPPLLYERFNGEAYRQATLAAYALDEFRQAKNYNSKVLKYKDVAPGTKKLMEAMSGQILQRLAEQRAGTYDWTTMGHKITEQQSLLIDRASFTSNVRNTRHGLVAAKDLEPGDLVLCEKAMVVEFNDIRESLALPSLNTEELYFPQADELRLAKVVYKLAHNPTFCAQYHKVHGGSMKFADGVHVIDIFQLKGVVEQNAVTQCYDELTTIYEPYGFWNVSAKCRTECLGNAQLAILSNMAIVHATQKIAKDQEVKLRSKSRLSISACGVDTCAWCQACKKEPPELKARRQAVVESWYDRLLMPPRMSIPAIFHDDSVKTILEQLRVSYESSDFEKLPKLELVRLKQGRYWEDLHPRNPHVKKLALQAFEEHGYFLTWMKKEKMYEITHPHGIMSRALVLAALSLAELHEDEGEELAAKQLATLARVAYKTVKGTPYGMMKAFEFHEAERQRQGRC
eukprot:Blabericola_migrator_1__1366@NODE_1355_length_4733_cov_207_171239_g910_i0_p1_GENE_NODE_1355_length_4733_cov_207_171239_g910_i0NODE_1355_length_4733_cov_207_171239_g910_i0_p1_ORF_typecomplete_len683_score132_67TPR_MalT/PF17874_1/0_047TPR_MalT/PF17874_1/61SET/PF00856_28/4e03SET/PF00856_28/0_036_NODE_1355_length_4733_cov_207_171239_g910_i021244172